MSPTLPSGLPPGRLLPAGTAAVWLSDRPVADPVAVWARCERARDDTGLWPLLIATPEVRPGETDLTAVGTLDLSGVLERSWRSYRRAQVKWLAMSEGADSPGEDPGAPFDHWPGLAAGVPASQGAPHSTARTALTRLMTGPYPLTAPHVALVPAARSADLPAVIGWQAKVPLPFLCALLRGWEERFGARVVAFDRETIHVSVARPPGDADHAGHLALEHVLSGADNVGDGTVRYSDYAAGLVGAPLWSFSWH
ncbi:DUF4253 domain-containing protein [Streptomyces sp. NPDC059597]|uniref:DUF4253 domain-containing protein n=1 Tax=Streptomyces sp. NPDC059597 TaxID=3346879 RepID=UPI0036BD7458